MKVQAINNQNNISHKAYFKRNEAYKMLSNKALLTDKLEIAKIDFYKDIPDHELEILKVIKNTPIKGFANLQIRNNTTRVIKDWLVPDNADALEFLLNSLWICKYSKFFKAEV